MSVTSASAAPADAASPREARATLATCGAAHAVHDGVGDCIYLFLPLWQAELGLSLAEVGAVKTMFGLGLAALQMPASLLAERVGERIVLALGTALLGLGYVLAGYAGGAVALGGAILLTGIGASVQHPLSSTLISRASSGAALRVALSTYNFLGDVGKVAVPALAAVLVGLWGWRATMETIGLAGIVVALAVFLLLRQLLQAGSAPSGAPPQGASTPAQPVATHWPRFANLGAIAALDSAARTGTLTLLPFVLIGKGAAVSTVGLALSLVFAGGAAGKFVCGLLAIRWGVVATVVATEIATAVAVLALGWLPLVAILPLLPLLGLALNGTSSALYGSVPETVSRDKLARAFGLFYTLSVGGSTTAPFLFGYLSDQAGLQAALVALACLVLAILPLTLPLRWLDRRA
ncbi:MAG: MFS transporter [Alphaproteobacteria bacterium]|nr:MFS transporter [Alphaproteobacteria bacterium]